METFPENLGIMRQPHIKVHHYFLLGNIILEKIVKNPNTIDLPNAQEVKVKSNSKELRTVITSDGNV